MLRVRAFQGLSPKPELAAEVACVPYDVVNREEAVALTAGNPHSLMHVDRAEIDLPADTDPYAEIVYATAKSNLDRLVESGALVREPAPVVYLYRQQMGPHTQTGVAAVCHIDDYENEIIRKHEKTRRDKEDDRTKLIGTLGADTGPVFLTYRPRAAIDALVAAETARTDDGSACGRVRSRPLSLSQPRQPLWHSRSTSAAWICSPRIASWSLRPRHSAPERMPIACSTSCSVLSSVVWVTARSERRRVVL